MRTRRPAIRLVATGAFLAVCAGSVSSASDDPAAEGTWTAVLLLSTVVVGAVLGRWSIMLGAALVAVMVLYAVLGPCDPSVAYSCDASVDPWWPVVLVDTVVLFGLLGVGGGIGRLVPRAGRHDE